MNTYELRQALLKRYSDNRRYAVAEEVGLTTGFSHRRIDMVVIDCYASNGFRIEGIEMKVSTSDLRRELQDPEKHTAFFELIDYFTLACPKGVIEPLMDVIPPKWGIIIVNEDGSTKYKRKPLGLEDKADKTVPRAFVASLTRSILKRQPAEIELQERYDQGFKDGTEREKRRMDYMADRVKREAEKLNAYDELHRRLSLWKFDNIDDALDKFEAFCQLDIEWTLNTLKRSVEKQQELIDKLTPDKESEDGAD